MHHMNMVAYMQNMNLFAQECDDNQVTVKPEQFTKSKGDAITEINGCLSGYDYFRSNVNTLYKSTMRYLQKAYNNLEACEADNTADV